MDSSGIKLMYNHNTVTTKIEQYIRDAISAAPLQDYICNQEAWAPATFQYVDWTAMYRALKSLEMMKRVNAIKYMFNWQNTGAQKQKFEAGVARREEREEHVVNKCPLQCGCPEEPQHYLQCKVLHEAHIVDSGLLSLYRWFSST